MNKQLNELSETELAELLENAQKALREKQVSKRKDVISQIRQLAASIGVSVEISEGTSPKASVQKGGKVPIKYRNPENRAEKWTGRGMKPKWLRELLEQGRRLEDFAV
jgi:DNA-binding protein H-NS